MVEVLLQVVDASGEAQHGVAWLLGILQALHYFVLRHWVVMWDYGVEVWKGTVKALMLDSDMSVNGNDEMVLWA